MDYAKRVKWRVKPCEFEAFEGRGGFRRLLPLAGLKVLEAKGPWEVLKGSSFRKEVNAVRRVAGRPPLKFEKVFKHGTGPLWDVGGS